MTATRQNAVRLCADNYDLSLFNQQQYQPHLRETDAATASILRTHLQCQIGEKFPDPWLRSATKLVSSSLESRNFRHQAGQTCEANMVELNGFEPLT
jgi:hypothetical protein